MMVDELITSDTRSVRMGKQSLNDIRMRYDAVGVYR
jgi:hypothetical protein